MTDEVGPLLVRVAEYVGEHHEATPDAVLAAADLSESYREQVEHYCAVTRYGLYHDHGANDDEDRRFNRVEWVDVAEWNVSPDD